MTVLQAYHKLLCSLQEINDKVWSELSSMSHIRRSSDAVMASALCILLRPSLSMGMSKCVALTLYSGHSRLMFQG